MLHGLIFLCKEEILFVVGHSSPLKLILQHAESLTFEVIFVIVMMFLQKSLHFHDVNLAHHIHNKKKLLPIK